MLTTVEWLSLDFMGNCINYFSNIITFVTPLALIYFSYLNDYWWYILELSLSTSSIVSKWTFLPASVTLLFQTLFSVILMIWARAAGPRFRLDQIFTLTWKDYFVTLSLMTIFLIVIYFIL